MELHADQALQTHLLVVVLEVDGQASVDIVSQTFALGHDFVAVPLCDVDFRGGHGLAHNGGLTRGRIEHDGSAALRDYASAGAFREYNMAQYSALGWMSAWLPLSRHFSGSKRWARYIMPELLEPSTLQS